MRALQGQKNISLYAMLFNTELFFSALGLAFVFESLPWILAPNSMRAFLLSLATAPTAQLRIMGLTAMGMGLGIVWLATG